MDAEHKKSGPIAQSQITCFSCGYDLSGTALGSTCPECGMAVAQTIAARTQPVLSSNKATASMVCGILSIVCFPMFGLVALVLAYLARREMERGGYSKASQTMASAGMIMGIIGTLICAAYFLLIFTKLR